MPSCVNIIDANDLDPVHRAQDWAELRPEGVQTDLDSSNVVEESHVPDRENRG